ncbi:hypothetical protein AB0G32_17780 [Streptomyces sp. NPDC023723]|uniref:hypothetical protein n=1 Tax=Streptomyces sp. NPDC023723 TaxID=3154323 RepID=UPI0034017470
MTDSAGGSVSEVVRHVAAEAEQAWEHYAVQGAVGPDTPAEIGDALSQIGSERAVDLLTYLAVHDLVSPGAMHRDETHARRAAERVALLLGYNATWHTNLTDLSDRVRAWDPVSRYTFDGVVAGTGGHFAVVLLRVGED